MGPGARVTRLRLRNFRCYERTELTLGESITVLHGHNGAGKTNLMEGLYFGCTGRSCRTSNEREVVRFGGQTTRVEIDVAAGDATHELTVGFTPGLSKRLTVDGATVESMLEVEQRPLISVFLPDRLELIKGPPALRRSHLDQFVAAVWPTRAANRRAYARALAQRNALLGRVRAGHVASSALDPWDSELASHGLALRDDRASAAARLTGPFAAHATALGLTGCSELIYRPRSRASTASELAGELLERRGSDLERGFTGHGPHRDELSSTRDGHELRSYGSQGEQRIALLALLLAERDVISEVRDAAPLMLLDDVMSELDDGRRERLVEVLHGGGQSVISTTDLAHVPGARDPRVTRASVIGGAVIQEARAA